MFTRRAASVIFVGALLLGTTGCSLYSEKATLIQYSPSDGAAAQVGDVRLLNVLAISTDGEDVSLVMTAVNADDEGVPVNFQLTDASGERVTETLYLEGRSSVSTGGEDRDPIVFRGVGAEVGGLLPVYVQYGDETGEQVMVPVLDASLEEYEDLVPEAEPAPTATPSGTPAPTPTPTTTPAG